MAFLGTSPTSCDPTTGRFKACKGHQKLDCPQSHLPCHCYHRSPAALIPSQDLGISLMEKPSMDELGARSKLLSFWGFHAVQCSTQPG